MERQSNSEHIVLGFEVLTLERLEWYSLNLVKKWPLFIL